ncbi:MULTISPECIES: hypothetical protein [unclassified Bradyrhizobium]
MARAKKHTTTKDPVFAAIERHRRAAREYREALVIEDGALDPDPEKQEKYGHRENKAISKFGLGQIDLARAGGGLYE